MTWFAEADVEAAARAICWAEIGGGRVSAASDVTTILYVNANWHRNVYQARAALTAIPDPRAAPNRLADVNASGIIDEVCGEWAIETPHGFATALWSRLLDAIAALKPEDKP